MMLWRRLWVVWAVLLVASNGIILPDKTEKEASSEISQVTETAQDTTASERSTVQSSVVGIDYDETSSDIAENIAELETELDRSYSKEVQDSDGGQRQDYASKNSGATIMDHAPGTKGSVNLLVPDKDRYMLTPCSTDKKWIVISLSEDIHVDAIVIANYEKFSSTVRDFLVLGSLNYPSETWFVFGNFTAANKNGEQLFEFHNKHHVRYIKLRMLTHYGSEYYCTMSQIKVYGRTVTQVMAQLEKSIEAESSAQTTTIPQTTTTPPKSQESIPPLDFCTVASPLELFLDQAIPKNQLNESCASAPLVVSSHDKNTTNTVKPKNNSSVASSLTTTGENATRTSDQEIKSNASIPSNAAPLPLAEDLTKPASNNGGASGGSGLDNFYTRMSKKVQILEVNLSHAEKAIVEAQRSHTKEIERLEKQLQAVVADLENLRDQMDKEMRFFSSSSDEYANHLNAIRQENMALRVEVELLWDVIRTMKAGIMVAIILSAALIIFFLCRWVFRCLSACHRRAARREWFRRLDAADLEVSDDDDDDINPLTHRMTHRVDRKLRFGTSYDDGAIQRNTMYRRIVNGFRQHHVQTKSGRTFKSTPIVKPRRSFAAPSKSGYSITLFPSLSTK